MSSVDELLPLCSSSRHVLYDVLSEDIEAATLIDSVDMGPV